MGKAILYVEPDHRLYTVLQHRVPGDDHVAVEAATGQEALSLVAAHDVDAVVLELALPDVPGLEVLRRLRSEHPLVPVIVMTSYGDAETAVAVMKAGAFDFLPKPANLEKLQLTIQRALEWRAVQVEVSVLKAEQVRDRESRGIVAESPAMRQVTDLIRRIAPTPATVLLTGETGTGKSLVAKMIHKLSKRSDGPFIGVNCAAIPDTLLESELFGYLKGAFTGATETRPGKFEAADGGTIFLDEIGELAPAVQAKLLHVTQERTFMRLGSNTPRSVDVRIVAATNRNLRRQVEEGKFREDLYYRLNVVGISIPPLRDRTEDIPSLVVNTLGRLAQTMGHHFQISPEAMHALRRYRWPGNVRELENVLERAALISGSHALGIQDLPAELIHASPTSPAPSAAGGRRLADLVDDLERAVIRQTLQEHGGNQSRTAQALGLSRQALLYKLKRLGL